MPKLKSEAARTRLFIISSVSIPVILLLVFTFYPAIKLLYYSFCRYDGLTPEVTWVGLYNWIKMLNGKEVWQTLSHCLYYIVGGVIQNVAGLFLAIILNNKNLKGKTFFRGIIFLPFILNGTAVSYMFRYLFDFTKGPINICLVALGLDPVSWLGNEQIVNWSMAFVCFWRFTGYIMIIYLGALQSIPKEYYEAAEIDGAGAFGCLRFITLPQIASIIGMQMFLNISGAVNIFDIPFVITAGGPVGASRTMAMQANDYAFTFNNYGMASAYGVFCTIVAVALYLMQEKLYKDEGGGE